MRTFAITCILLGFFGLVGCGSTNSGTSGSEPSLNSTGTYTDTQKTWLAEVSENNIAIYHTETIDGKDVKILYWDGTWDHTEASVDSKASKRLAQSFTGSTLKQKNFAVGTDAITFEYGIHGTYWDVHLEKQ